MTPSALDAQVIVVGAGPAGCAAALMATSLGMDCLLVDATGKPGGRLRQIQALSNVPGGWRSGAALADALHTDLGATAERCSLVAGVAQSVSGLDDRVEVTLIDGQVLVGQYAIVATGVRPAAAQEASWVAVETASLPFVWEATEPLDEAIVVLGADRPLGTWLRSHPGFDGVLTVLHPTAEMYKADEVRTDARARLVAVQQATVQGVGPFEVEARLSNGEHLRITAQNVLVNLGSVPAHLPGLAVDGNGYCPPDLQHPRVTVAGDLRSRQYQRIATAQGSGAEAALHHYYRAQISLSDRHQSNFPPTAKDSPETTRSTGHDGLRRV